MHSLLSIPDYGCAVTNSVNLQPPWPHFYDRLYPRIVSQINSFSSKLPLSEYFVIVTGNGICAHDIFTNSLIFHFFMELWLWFGVSTTYQSITNRKIHVKSFSKFACDKIIKIFSLSTSSDS